MCEDYSKAKLHSKGTGHGQSLEFNLTNVQLNDLDTMDPASLEVLDGIDTTLKHTENERSGKIFSVLCLLK